MGGWEEGRLDSTLKGESECAMEVAPWEEELCLLERALLGAEAGRRVALRGTCSPRERGREGGTDCRTDGGWEGWVPLGDGVETRGSTPLKKAFRRRWLCRGVERGRLGRMVGRGAVACVVHAVCKCVVCDMTWRALVRGVRCVVCGEVMWYVVFDEV